MTEMAQPDSGSLGKVAFYADHFGFKERPFSLVPDPEFLFWSAQHRRAFSVLEFGIMSRSPITMITGGVGCGKTTLLRELLRRIDGSVTIGLVSNAQGGRGELLLWVLNALNVEFDPNLGYVRLFQLLQDFLVDEYAQGRHVILIFDEAQNLSAEGLEELRMLTNINSDKDELIQLVLVGQPELRQLVLRPQMRQLAQRIAASFHLNPMDKETVAAFISHRLRVAGGTGQEFDDDACALVAEATKGIPRLVNQLCDLALLYAWTSDSYVVTRALVQAVLDDGVLLASQSVETDDVNEP